MSSSASGCLGHNDLDTKHLSLDSLTTGDAGFDGEAATSGIAHPARAVSREWISIGLAREGWERAPELVFSPAEIPQRWAADRVGIGFHPGG
jgi:hypothetical protein